MKLLKKLLALMIVLFLLACGYLGYKGYQDYETALSAMSMEAMEQKIQSIGNYTKLENLPETYVKAVLAVEDKRFYRHFGIDLIATCRAFVNDIKAMAPVEGGSTITQQLAKNQYFSQEKKITRKIAELFMAFKIEQSFTKDKILEMYVNSIFFGNNYYCVGDDECTMLAGIPNAPSVYNPVVNPELARQRQQQVIRKMERCGDVFQGRR